MIVLLLQLLIIGLGSYLAFNLAEKDRFIESIFVVFTVFCAFSFVEIQYYTPRLSDFKTRTTLFAPCEVDFYGWKDCGDFTASKMKCSVGRQPLSD